MTLASAIGNCTSAWPRKADMIAGREAMANLAARSRAEDRSLLNYLAILRSTPMRIFLEAQKKGHAYDCALLSSRIVNVLELTAKVTGELREHSDGLGITINNVNAQGAPVITLSDPEVAKVQATVIRALRPYPEAREAVIAPEPPLIPPANPASGYPNGNGREPTAWMRWSGRSRI
jgi:hypothetical protein